MRKRYIIKIMILTLFIIEILINTKIFAVNEKANETQLSAKEGQYVYTINDTYLINREGCYEDIDTSLDKTHKYKIFENLGNKASSTDTAILAGKSKLVFMSNKNALYGKLELSKHTKISSQIKELGNETTQWTRVRVDVAGEDKKETDVGYSWKSGWIDNSNLIFVYTVAEDTNLYTYNSSTKTYTLDPSQIAHYGDEYRINKLENDYIKIEKIENGNLTRKTAYIQREKLIRKMFNWNDSIPQEYKFTKSSNVIDNMLAIAYYVRTLHPQYSLLTPISYIDGVLSFNCSGFVQFVMKYAGIDIKNLESANEMYNSLKDNELWEQKREITHNNTTLNMPLKTSQNNTEIYKSLGNTVINSLKKGDILYFKTSMDYSEVTHIGIYVGDGMFIHSSGGSGVICTKLIDWLNGGKTRDLMGYSRYIKPNLEYEKDFSDIQKYKTYSDITIDARVLYDDNVQNKFIKVKAKKYKDKINYSKSKAILNESFEKIGIDSKNWNDNYESYNMADQTFYFNDKKDLNMHYLHLLLYKNDDTKEEIVIGPIIFEINKDSQFENTNTYQPGEIVAILKNNTIIDNTTNVQEEIKTNKLMKYLGQNDKNVILKDLDTNKKYLVDKKEVKNVYQSKSNTAYLRSTPEAPSDNSNLITQLDNGEIIVEITKQNAYFNKYYIIDGNNAGKIGYLSNNINKTKIVTEIEEIIPITNISFTSSNKYILKNESLSLSLKYTPENTNVDKSIIWSSSNTNIATVINGKVTAKSKGTVTITAKSKYNEKIKSTIQVIVYEKLRGDVTYDGLVDIADAYTLLRKIISTNELEILPEDLPNGDFDESGIIDITDAYSLLRHIVKNI